MAEVGTAYVTILPSTRGFSSALNRSVGPGMTSAGASAGKKFGSGFIGRAAKTGALIGVALTGVAIKSAVTLEAEFSKTLNTIGAIANVPQKGLKTLSDLAIKRGAATVFSANDAAQAMLELSKGGLDVATIKAGALQSALTLAAAGGLPMAEAASVMGNALNTFSLEGEQAAQVAAALAGAANASSADVKDLAYGLAASGVVAADMGLDVQETTGALAALSNAGLSGSDAGTSLKTFLSRVVPQTDKAEKAMHALGLKFTWADGSVKSLSDMAGQLQARLGHLSQEERTTALNTIFGSDARRAATILMKEGADGVDKYVKSTSNRKAAEKAADAAMKGTAGSIEAMKGSIETLMLTFGMALKPVTMFVTGLVTSIANAAVPVMQKFGDYLKNTIIPNLQDFGAFIMGTVVPAIQAFADKAKEMAASLRERFAGQITTVIDTVKEKFDQFVGVVTTVFEFLRNNKTVVAAFAITVGVLAAAVGLVTAATTLWTAALALNPVGIIIIAVAALVAGLVYAYKTSDKFRKIVNNAWAAIKAAVADAWPRIKATLSALVTGFKNVVSYVASHWGSIKDVIKGVLDAVGTIIRGGFTVIKGIIQTVMAVIRGDWADAWEGIKNILKGAWTVIVGMVKGYKTILVAAVKLIWEAVKAGAKLAWEAIKAIVAAGLGKIVDLVKSLPQKLVALVPQMLAAGKALMGALVDGLKNSGDLIGDIAGNVWDAVKGMLNGAIDKINAALSFKIEIPMAPDISYTADIPHLASGGIVSKPTLAVIGEGKEPEAVVPLSQLAEMGGGGRGGMFGDVHVQAHDYNDFMAQMQRRSRAAAAAYS